MQQYSDLFPEICLGNNLDRKSIHGGCAESASPRTIKWAYATLIQHIRSDATIHPPRFDHPFNDLNIIFVMKFV